MGIKPLKMTVEFSTRLCNVKDRTGYFHCWEHFSKPIPPSRLIGGAPGGVFSKIFGIVEFSDGVKRIDPTDIKFCDEENCNLANLEKTKHYIYDDVFGCLDYCDMIGRPYEAEENTAKDERGNK